MAPENFNLVQIKVRILSSYLKVGNIAKFVCSGELVDFADPVYKTAQVKWLQNVMPRPHGPLRSHKADTVR